MRLPEQPRAFISGGGSGLGRAIALELARRQARVLVADISAAAAEKVAEEIRAAGGESHPIACDVTKPEQVESAAREMEQIFGGVDLVVNNAGVAAGGPVGEFSLKDWEWIVAVNFWGVLYGCHAFVPRLKAQGHGALLNVASAAGFASLPEMGAYNATKAAVVSLSETLYGELGRHGVGVSVLCPTFFRSGLMQSFRSPTDRHRQLADNIFAKSKVKSEDVARAAIKGVERGTLHILPQLDAKLVWALKRWTPALYFRALRNHHERAVERLLAT
ncbi:MAG: SDR family NAD(P)-dependent oxidoreductase [Myxococcaceae bacterium]